MIFSKNNSYFFFNSNKKIPIPIQQTEYFASLYTIFYDGCWYEKADTLFFYIFQNTLWKKKFENRIVAHKLENVKIFWSYPLDYFRHRYYSRN